MKHEKYDEKTKDFYSVKRAFAMPTLNTVKQEYNFKGSWLSQTTDVALKDGHPMVRYVGPEDSTIKDFKNPENYQIDGVGRDAKQYKRSSDHKIVQVETELLQKYKEYMALSANNEPAQQALDRLQESSGHTMKEIVNGVLTGETLTATERENFHQLETSMNSLVNDYGQISMQPNEPDTQKSNPWEEGRADALWELEEDGQEFVNGDGLW